MSMGEVAKAICLIGGHGVGKDIDPTGGDPWMGGPVLITVCERCGAQMPESDDAILFNRRVMKVWQAEADSHPSPWPPKKQTRWFRWLR